MKSSHEIRLGKEIALKDCIQGVKYEFALGFDYLKATYIGTSGKLIAKKLLIRFDDEDKNRSIPYNTKIFSIKP